MVHPAESSFLFYFSDELLSTDIVTVVKHAQTCVMTMWSPRLRVEASVGDAEPLMAFRRS